MAGDAEDLFNVAAVMPDFEEKFAACQAASDRTREGHPARLDVAYGPLPRNRLDLFFPSGAGGPATRRPIHMFVHGGYWRGQVKEDYAFVAEGAIAAGAIAAIIEYTLMPGARMLQLVHEVRLAAAWLRDHAAEFGGNGDALSASGHSAGGHLCSYLGSRAPQESEPPPARVKSLLMLSGIFDLRPIATSYLQPTLQLTPQEIADWSPFEAVPGEAHYEVVVGHAETEPFHVQARDYAEGLARRGARVERLTAAGHDHMSLTLELGQPGRPMAELVREAVERSLLA